MRVPVGKKGTARTQLFEAQLRLRALRQGALVAVLAVVLAVPPVFVNHPIGYLPLLVYAMLLLLCWGYLRIVSRGFSVEHDFSEISCVRGGTVDLPIVLKNRSRLPILHVRPQVFVKNPYGELEHEAQAVAMIGPMDDEVLNTKVELGHVGKYTAGLRGAVLYDPMMLFHAFARVDGQAVVVSTPQTCSADSLDLSELASRESLAPVRTVLSDDVDYAGTRDYEFGDPLKSVHWKLSARTDELQTRLFETSVNTRMSVIMDFHAPDYSTERLMCCADVVVEMALAVMRLARERNMEASLRYVDGDGLAVARDLPHGNELEALVESLPQMSAAVSQHDAINIVEREMSPSGGLDNIVLCTSSLTRELVACAEGLSARHVRVSIVLAVPKDSVRGFYRNNQGLVGELQAAGVTCLVLSQVSGLEGRGRRG